MIQRKSQPNLDPWLDRARASLVASFANGVIKDKAAVGAAIDLPWSNGQTEGQITKLKLVKTTDVRSRKTRPPSGSNARRQLITDAPTLRQSQIWKPIDKSPASRYSETIACRATPCPSRVRFCRGEHLEPGRDACDLARIGHVAGLCRDFVKSARSHLAPVIDWVYKQKPRWLSARWKKLN
jgi:hypothetical protein